jgi:ankyrin repeat protein
MCQPYPSGASERSGKGSMPLHVVLESKASMEMVAALVAAHPESAELLNKEGAERVVAGLLCAHAATAAAEDRHGNLPLHLALRHEASAEIVQGLLFAHPEAAAHRNNDGALPIHVAIANDGPANGGAVQVERS